MYKTNKNVGISIIFEPSKNQKCRKDASLFRTFGSTKDKIIFYSIIFVFFLVEKNKFLKNFILIQKTDVQINFNCWFVEIQWNNRYTFEFT